MISRKCPLLLWLVFAMHLLSIQSYRPKGGPSLGDVLQRRSSSFNNSKTPMVMAQRRRRSGDPSGEPDPCEQFSVPDEVNQEFFSPGFNRGNENYTSNADCVLRLKAPPGQIIQLDFRDYFQIEQSQNCLHDYLEVLDGAEGYNRPLRTPICGFDFPEPITSTDRYLWLRFKSDENIEYKGFKGVYEFKDRPKNATQVESMECKKDLPDQEEGEFDRNDIASEYKDYIERFYMPYDCVWNITVKENWRIQLQFDKFSLEKPNECTVNFIQIFYDKTDKDHLLQEFCGSIAEPVNSKGNVMFVRFFAEHNVPKSTFKANFTAFRPLDKNLNENQACDAGEFNCEDSTCISETLRCNSKINCRFRWDEEGCDTAESISFKNDHIIIIMVVFSLILSGMCFTFIFNCIKKLIRDHRTIQAYITQSREQQLNKLEKSEQIDKKVCKSLSRSRSRSNSRSPSTDSPNHVEAATTTPCYVPGGELLPIVVRNEHTMSPSNGDAYNQNIYTVDNEGGPEMCDSACQTRESLFTTQGYSSGHSTPNHSVHTNSPPAPFSTFGYKKDSSKFKAEARIEVLGNKKRPYSVQTTKSAPDVIVTH